MDRRLLILALGMFALGTDSFVVAGVLPQISHAFHVSIGSAGQMTTVYAITYALLAPTIAALAAGVPRKKLLLSGLGVFVVANLATAVAPTFLLALLTRMVAGVGAAMFAPTATGAAATIVPAERRGFALSVVIAGLTAATALGSPTGAVIGGLGDWRWTMVFVSALAAVSLIGIAALLSNIPLPPAISLKKRIAPIADPNVALTLLTTLVYMSGIFTVYTYFSVVFDRVTNNSPLMLGGLLVLWGASGTIANLTSGRLIDTIGSRKVILGMLLVLLADLALIPWSSASLWSAMLSIAVFGAVGWGLLVPQQHRLVTLAPQTAPVVLGLNTACTYLGVTTAGVVGAIGIDAVGAHNIPLIATLFCVVALIVSEFAGQRIAATGPMEAIAA
ncbi:MAG TPA: MFS transporter [Gemmatimonadaceae bacterium]|jgi:predicted MFS family arabinose efflux permease